MTNDPKLQTAFFLNKNNEIINAQIRIMKENSVSIDVYKNDIKAGYTRVYFHPNNRFFLDVIYCYDQFRGLNIASYMSELVDYILKDYQGSIIRGVFNPSQLSTDREDNITCSLEELNNRAFSFYSKAGYKIVSYDEFILDKSKFESINEEDDFQRGGSITKQLVYKKLTSKSNYNFIELDGIIYHKNIVDLQNKNTK